MAPTGRRQFLTATASLGVSTWLGARSLGTTADGEESTRCPQVCLFTKCFQKRDLSQLVEAVIAAGHRRVDLTVRPGGHVVPERVRVDLPKAKETLGRAGIAITMLTTDITAVQQKHAIDILRTAADLDIRYLKLGYYRYPDSTTVQRTHEDAKGRLGELMPLLAKHRIRTGFHNHSGMYVGAMLWDEWELIRNLDPRWIGSYFDPCHATIEGGSGGWRLGLGLLLPRINMVAIKDFEWRRENDRWRPRMVPLGEGAVQIGEVLKSLNNRAFTGPISLHVEHTPAAAPGSPEEKTVLEAVRKDTAVLNAALAGAGLDGSCSEKGESTKTSPSPRADQ